MNHLKKTVFAALFLAVALFAGTVNVFAEGLSVTADKEECATGEAFTVTIDASSVGDGTIPPDIQVEFDSNRLNFENCSAEYGGGGGGLVTFKDTKATVDFTTLSGGAAEVKVTATADDAASPETASVSVSVSGEDTAAALEAQSTSSTGVSPGTVDIGDGRVVQAVFSDEFMPPIFHKEVTEYNGQTVECAKFDMGDIVLLYTSDAAGNDGNLMMFNAVTGELSDYRMIRGIENRFIIVLSDCEGPVPDGYIKAVLEWDNQTLTAFMENSVAEGTSAAVGGVDPADFFLVYAVSSEGNKGWYRYDKNEGTYQRFISTGDGGAEGTPEGGDDETSSSVGILDDYIPSNVQSIIALICAPLVLILIITVIILAVKYHGLSEDFEAYFEGEGYYGDEEDEEEQYTRRPSRAGAVTASSLVERSMSEDEEEEDEDEEDDEDEDVEEDDTDEDDADEEEEEEEEEEEDEEEEDDEDDREGYNDDEDDVKYYRPLTRKERRELAREERWREKEEKKAAKRRAKGYEEATPMDWSSFGKEMEDEPDDRRYKKSKPPKYMTQSMEDIPEDDEEEDVDRSARKSQLPPRKKAERTEDEVEAPRVLHEEDMREKQRRLFEQQQRIEDQRRIENEEREAERLRQQQQFIASKDEELDLDEDFHFEFLNLD